MAKYKHKPIPVEGQRFGLLTVLSPAAPLPNGLSASLCKCECGAVCIKPNAKLKYGHIRSCGCRRSKGRLSHGKATSVEYKAWHRMVQRCENPRHHRYYRYGARGIKICDRWRSSFENFYADMGPRPSPSHSIDRINNDGDYTPENCRWATSKQQAWNRASNLRVTFNGKTQSLNEWEKETGIPARLLGDRLKNKKEWTVERALTTPKKQ